MVDYNKENHKITKPRAYISGSGPRDLQRRQKEARDSAVVAELKQQLDSLAHQLKNNKTSGMYTAEEFDSELNKAIKQVAEEMENKHAKTIKAQKEEINKLKRMLDDYSSTKAIVGLTDDQVNDAVNIAVAEALQEEKQSSLSKLNKLQQEVAELINSKKEAEEKVIELKKQLTEFKEKVVEVDQLKATLEATKSHLADIKKGKDPEHLKSEITTLNSKVDKLSTELEKTKIDLAVANSKIESKDEVIKAKDSALEALKDRPVTVQVSGVTTQDPEYNKPSNRPKMEQAFIDPTEKKDLAPHLKFKDVKIAEREVMSAKVDRLKDLLGGLPNK